MGMRGYGCRFRETRTLTWLTYLPGMSTTGNFSSNGMSPTIGEKMNILQEFVRFLDMKSTATVTPLAHHIQLEISTWLKKAKN